MKKGELSAMTIAELKALAKKRKISMPAVAKKVDIIKALADAAPKAARKPAKSVVSKKAAKKAAKKLVKKKALTGKKAAAKPAAKAPKKKATGKTPAAKRTAARNAVAVKPSAALPEWKMPGGWEAPHPGQELVIDAKFFTGTPDHRPPMPYDALPHEYGEERMTILARDPHMAFSFWELPQARLEKEKSWFGWDSKLCVRVYDVTGVQFNGANAAAYYDQEVYERVGSWYFDIGRPTHSFCADLGLIAPDGRFLTLVRSNTVTMPRDGVSDVLDEEWMLVEEEFLKLYGIPGTGRAGRGIHGGLSSPEAQEILRQRRLLEITSPGTFSRKKQRKK